ncbi:MAG: polysaccharide biosynthesis tyrosine autokinase [Chitinophagaceae bacterium]
MEQEATTSKDNLELKSLFFKYLHYWYLFVISLILALVVWHYYMKYSVPVYQVKARFMVKTGSNVDNSLAGTQDVFSGLGSGISNSINVSNELEIIKSRYVVGMVVKALDLNITYTVMGRIKNTELYDKSPIRLQIVAPKDSLPWKHLVLKLTPNSDSYQLQTGENTYRRLRYYDTVFYSNFHFVITPNPRGQYNEIINVDIAPFDETVVNYLGGIQAQNINDGTVIQLSTNTTVPKKGEDIINVLYDVYANISLEDKNRVIDSTVKFIEQRMTILHQEIMEAQDSVTKFLIAYKILPPDAASLSTSIGKVVSEMGEVSEVRYQLNLLDAFVEKVKAGGYPIVPSDMELSTPDFKTYATAYNTMVLSRAHYLEYSGPENPVLIDLENQIRRATVNMLAAAGSERGRYMQELAKSEKTYTLSNDTLSKIPVFQKIYQQLTNGLDVEQELYTMLLNKKESMDIYRAGSSSNSKLIDPAKCDASPVSPKGSLLHIMAIGIGLAVPVTIIALIGLFDNKIRTKKEVLDVLHVPVVGEIGHNRTATHLVVKEKARSVLAEQFRILRTNLQFLTSGKTNPIVVFTSSMSGEGKSFNSLNTALSLAISGKKVLIMELDLRKPQISQMLKLDNHNGYTNYMISDIPVASIIKSSGIDDHLFLISSGPVPPNPSELLMQEKTASLLSEVKTMFDYVVVDTAPIGLVTDAFIIAKFADVMLYVIRQNYTLKGQLGIARNMIKEDKIRNVGVVLNDIRSGQRYGYGYGYGYGYSYSYGYGVKNEGYYGEDVGKSAFLSNIAKKIRKINPFKK